VNERIKELYLEASEQFKIVQDQELPAPYQTRAFAEKFAELIIQECIQIVHIETYDSLRVEAAIQTHFGVE